LTFQLWLAFFERFRDGAAVICQTAVGGFATGTGIRFVVILIHILMDCAARIGVFICTL
jgi:hypothetical protein